MTNFDKEEKIKVDLCFEKAWEIVEDPYLSILYKYKDKQYSDYLTDNPTHPNPLSIYIEELHLNCSVIVKLFSKQSTYDSFEDTKTCYRYYYLLSDFQNSVLEGYWNFRILFAEELYISSHRLLEQLMMHKSDGEYDFEIITKTINKLNTLSEKLEFLKVDFENRLRQHISFERAVQGIFEEGISEKAKELNSSNLTDTESNILEALANKAMKGPELLKQAGYENSSHYRQILSNLVKREILGRGPKGYYAISTDTCQ